MSCIKNHSVSTPHNSTALDMILLSCTYYATLAISAVIPANRDQDDRDCQLFDLLFCIQTS